MRNSCGVPVNKISSLYKKKGGVQSNLYKTRGSTQKWSCWASDRLIKHLYQTTTTQMWSFVAGFYFFFSVIFPGIKIWNHAYFGATLED